MYSAIYSVDNTPPILKLKLTLDNTKNPRNIMFSEQTIDNVDLVKLYLRIRKLDSTDSLREIEFEPMDIITVNLDLSDLEPGMYNLELSGEDAAGNISRVSRNIEIDKTLLTAKVDLFYPFEHDFLNGNFNVYGSVASELNVDSILLYIDNRDVKTTTLEPTKYFKFSVTNEDITTGEHSLYVRISLSDGSSVQSETTVINYSTAGPWITVDNLALGDFVYNRQYL